ncbi:MAG: molybdopterin molybdotransferase MoeA [Verrucomicrobiales bacterium]|nr:molybdopterin molybdotransferase MoeA [Verrucomicrobiales bacterium]
MITLEEALDRILSTLAPLPEEVVSVSDAVGRVPTEDLMASTDLPPFDNSAVDGYALRSADVAGASVESPVVLEVTDTIKAGEAPAVIVGSGSCVRIMTGALLPAGADAVVMQEDVVIPRDGQIAVRETVGLWEGVRMAGGDVRRGVCLVRAGEALRPAHVGLLVASGYAKIPVHRRPRVTLLSTGSELIPPGGVLNPGQVYDSNSPLMRALAEHDGFPVVHTGHIPDTMEQTMAELHLAARQGDVVVTTGGVSVGEADFVKPAMAALGGSLDVWRIAIKPGKPFAFGRLGAAYWFGLPGNPVSAYVTWWLLVRPALRRLLGMRIPQDPRISARLGEPIVNRGDRRHFIRVRFDEQGYVRLAGTQASHVQSGLVLADALLDMPPEAHWETGREVEVDLIC